MIKLFKYTYIVIYRWNSRGDGEVGFPQFNALLLVSLCQLFVVFDLILLSGILAKFQLFPNDNPPNKIPIVIFMFLLLFCDYRLFYYKEKYKTINQEFELLPSETKRRWSIFVALFIIVTFLLLITLAVIYGIVVPQ